MSNLSNNIQNIEASRSTIEGMDFVAEAADLAKNQILAQLAEAMLVQASALSQNVLGFLAPGEIYSVSEGESFKLVKGKAACELTRPLIFS